MSDLRILILGGTRFIGRASVAKFLELGAEVTVVSRRALPRQPNLHQLTMNREDFLSQRIKQSYDYVIDFISYDEKSLVESLENIRFKSYLFISSAWVPSLWGGSDPSEIRSEIKANNEFSDKVSLKYILGKWRAELAAVNWPSRGKEIAVLRLPPVLGVGDHTERTSFYAERVLDDWPLLLPKGYDFNIQFLDIVNMVPALVEWVLTGDSRSQKMWTAIPNGGVSYNKFLLDLMKYHRKGDKGIVYIEEGDSFYPTFLRLDPLIGTPCMQVCDSNILDQVGDDSAPLLFSHTEDELIMSPSRKLETEYVTSRRLEA